MAKILTEGELGFGILLENDAGYISSELNPNLIKEGFDVKENEPILINCILQKYGVKNKNGRIYPKEILVPQVNEYQKLIDMGAALGESDHPECVLASESKILTKDGWKSFHEISDNEIVLTHNNITGVLEYQKIDKKILQPYKGIMYNLKSNNLECTVTPNHRLQLSYRNNDTINEYYVADAIESKVYSSGKYKFHRTGKWAGNENENFIIPKTGVDNMPFNCPRDMRYQYEEDLIIPIEVFMAYLGLWLADGHTLGSVSGEFTSYDCVITQQKESTKSIIEEMLSKIPLPLKMTNLENGNAQYHICDSRLYNFLAPLGNSDTKYIPTEIKNLSPKYLEILFKWFQLGDGRNVNTEKSKKESVFSTNERLINDLHEVLLKCGGAGNITISEPTKDRVWKEYKTIINSSGEKEKVYYERIVKKENIKPIYNLNISRSKNIWFDKRHIKITKVEVDDLIACVQVPNGNFFVMVNGKSHLTGNSSNVSLTNVSHALRKIWWGTTDEDRHVLYGKLEIITSPGYHKFGICSTIGDQILNILRHKLKIGISSRGVGTLKEVMGQNLVQNDFELICFDLVHIPSTPGAYLFPDKNEIEIFNNELSKDRNINESSSKIIKALDDFLN